MDKDYYTATIIVHSNGKNKLFAELFVLFTTIFCQKAQNSVWLGPYDFVQISQACGPNTYEMI